YQLHAAAGPEQVPELALGAGDAYSRGVLAEDALHGDRLGQVALLGAGAVGIDVIDIASLDAAVVQGALHGLGGAGPFGVGLGDVSAVGAGAVAQQLGKDACPACFG